MNLKVVSLNVGKALLVSALFMFLSMMVSVFNGMDSSFGPLAISFIVTLLVGSFPFIFVKKSSAISMKDGFLIVVLAWFLSFVFGMLPYVLWGGDFTLLNAWFESVSGFTTTGATILTNIEDLPKGLLFWRSSTHFIGGLGVVVFLLLVLPQSSPFRLKLTNIEMSALSREGYRYKSSKKVYVFLEVYLVLTVAAFICFMLAGMSCFDAINHAFSVVATGGFSVKNSSIATYDSRAIEVVCIVFMMLASTHFGMLYAAVVGRTLKPLKSPAIKYFYGSAVVVSVIIAIQLMVHGVEHNWGRAFIDSLFQTVSYITSTGFGSVDNSIWPIASCTLLMLVAFHCGTAGSTTGAIKSDRAVMAFKSIGQQLRHTLYPNSVSNVSVGGHAIHDDAILKIMQFIVLYTMILAISIILLVIIGMPMTESVSASISTLGNVGAALGDLGTMGNYGAVPAVGKFILTLNMFLGRLEIYPVLVVFMMMFKRGK